MYICIYVYIHIHIYIYMYYIYIYTCILITILCSPLLCLHFYRLIRQKRKSKKQNIASGAMER